MSLNLSMKPVIRVTDIKVPANIYALQRAEHLSFTAEISPLSVLEEVYAKFQKKLTKDERDTFCDYILLIRKTIQDDVSLKTISVTGDLRIRFADSAVLLDAVDALHLVGEALLYPKEAAILHDIDDNSLERWRIAYTETPVKALELQKLLDSSLNRWDTTQILTVTESTVDNFHLAQTVERIINPYLFEMVI